jgi:tRNA A37 methylthiotransferase MiaB
MRQLPEDLKKQRSERLSIIAKEIQQEINEKWIGRTVEATIVDEFKQGGMIARSDEYKTIAIEGCPNCMMGRRISALVESSTPYYLKGRIIRR